MTVKRSPDKNSPTTLPFNNVFEATLNPLSPTVSTIVKPSPRAT